MTDRSPNINRGIGTRAAHDYLMRKELAGARRGTIRAMLGFGAICAGLVFLAIGFGL
jgi:hypothetical protein